MNTKRLYLSSMVTHVNNIQDWVEERGYAVACYSLKLGISPQSL